MGSTYRRRIAAGQNSKAIKQLAAALGQFAGRTQGSIQHLAEMIGTTHAVMDAIVEVLGEDFEAKVRVVLDRRVEEAKARDAEAAKLADEAEKTEPPALPVDIADIAEEALAGGAISDES